MGEARAASNHQRRRGVKIHGWRGLPGGQIAVWCTGGGLRLRRWSLCAIQGRLASPSALGTFIMLYDIHVVTFHPLSRYRGCVRCRVRS